LEDLLSGAREIDDLLTSHIVEDELGLFFVRPKPLSRPLRKLLTPKLPDDEPEESAESLPKEKQTGAPQPTETQRTFVVTREVLRVPCRYCGTLTDPIRISKCPSCGGRPI
jgi:hypothetical protein